MPRVISDLPDPSKRYLNRIKLVHGDITKQHTDAIVSVLPQSLEYGGALNEAILAAAGHRLDDFVLEHIYKPRPGDLYAVPGFNLPCKNILFAILPKWSSEFDRQDKYLLNAVRKAMETTRTMCLGSVSFPPLVTGKNGYPPQKATRLIVQAILDRMDASFKEVRIVCRSKEAHQAFEERLKALGWKP